MAQADIFDSVREAKDRIKDKIDDFAKEGGEFTKRLDQESSRIPSIGFLGLAVGSMVLSAALQGSEERKPFANFVGLWAPTFLLFGIYNKIVKLEAPKRRMRF